MTRLLPGDHPSTHNAALWLRQHLGIEPGYTIFAEFEQHFNCRIDVSDRADTWMQPNTIEFPTAEELTMFVLRWS